MRMLLSTYGSRGDAEPMVGLAVQLRARQPVRPLVTGALSPSAAGLPRRTAEMVAAQFDTVAAAAEECDALVATGVVPAGVWL